MVRDKEIETKMDNQSDEQTSNEEHEESQEQNKELSLEEQIDLLKQELEDKQDRLLRLSAEFENYKKRLDKDKEDACKFANESLIKELLPVIDNLSRAIEHSEENIDTNVLQEGVEMTFKGLLCTLEKWGLKPIDACGEKFDPNIHEAISQEQRTDVPPNTVIKELQKGYLLKERLLRPAMVIVSKS